MNRKQGVILFVVFVALLISVGVVTAQGPTPQAARMPSTSLGTAFTYQGQLKNNGAPVNTTCDFQFGLWDASTLGAQVGTTQTVSSVVVTNGLFTTPIDFGAGAFESSARFLAMAVKCGSSANYAALTPRQEVTMSPYAVYAANGPFWDQYGNSSTNPTYNFVGTTDAQSLVFKTNNAERMRILSNGNLGIGTTNPRSKLEIQGNWNGQFGALTLTGDKPTIRFSGGFVANHQQWIMHEGGNGPGNLEIDNGNEQGTIWNNVLSMTSDGNVGIGTTNPSGLLNVNGTSWFQGDTTPLPAAAGKGIALGYPNGADFGYLFAFDYGTFAPKNLLLNHPGGNVGIGTTNPTAKLDVAGTMASNIVQIRGGSDLAEKFDASNAAVIEPGTLMVIDENNPGKLKPSDQPYDTKVAGVASGAGGVNPGLTLQQEGVMEGDTVVAIAGRVYVKADATINPIKPGDLLTTSSIPGYAMKATDRERAQGAIIGKAMSELKEGTGLVLVLVNLQ